MTSHQFSEAQLQHIPGLVHLSQNKSLTSTKKVFSCGADENISLIKLTENGELEIDTHRCPNTSCQSAMAVFEDEIYVGCTTTDAITGNDQQVVVKYSAEPFLASPPLVTFSLEVTSVDISSDGVYLAVGSSDFVLKILNLKSQDSYDRYECDGEVVYVSIDPKNRWVAVGTTSGNVDIRRLLSNDSEDSSVSLPPSSFKTISSFNRITKDSPRMQCCWSPEGDVLYLPAMGGIFVVDTNTWSKKKSLTCKDVEPTVIYSITCLLSDGSRLAAYAMDRSIVLWDVTESCQISRIRTSEALDDAIVTSLIFYPTKDDTLILADSRGYVRALALTNAILDTEKEDDSLDEMALFRVDDDDDVDGDLALIKSQFGFKDGVHVSELPPTAPTSKDLFPDRNREPCCTIKSMSVPTAFVTGSTPIHLSERYLKWNIYGVIRSFNNDGDSSIEIEFHDANVHSEIVIDNTTSNFTIGDLNNEMVALASNIGENDESHLSIHHIGAWDSDSRQWSVKMPTDEHILNLCVGDCFIAVYTDQRYIRIFTPAGTQRAVFSTSGPILTMCAHDEILVLVRATGSVLVTGEKSYEHQYYADIYQVRALSSGSKSLRPFRSICIALSPKSKLEWVSISNAGNLIIMDSKFVIRLLSATGIWYPILEGATLLKNLDEDAIWPIAAREMPEMQVRYIYCKASRYPKLVKHIAPIIEGWKLPLCNVGSDKTKLEHDLLLNEMMQTTAELSTCLSDGVNPSALANKYLPTLIKLFALACKGERNVRAAELANLATSKGIQSMCNYAATIKRAQLVDKVTKIGRKRLDQETEESTFQNSLTNERIAPSRHVQLKRKPMIKNGTLQESQSPSLMDIDSQTTVRSTNSYLDESRDEYLMNTTGNTSLNDSAFHIPNTVVEAAQKNFSVNPFKRAKILDQNTSGDFFDQLSTTSTSSENLKKQNDVKTFEKPVKKQSKLAFSDSISLSSTRTVLDSISLNQNNDTQVSTQKKSGYQLWREGAQKELLDSYNGLEKDFDQFAIGQFRKLPREEQRTWNEIAKNSQA